MSAYQAQNHFYAPEGRLINADRMRRDARKRVANGESSILHRHAAYDDCADFGVDEHEFYGLEEDGNE